MKSVRAHRENTRALFDGVAPWYDAMNRRMSLGLDLYWRRRAVRLCPDNDAQRVLDVATGTADLAICAGRRGRAQVVGIDLSGKMLTRGREKVAQAGLLGRVALLQGDTFALPFPDNTFDVVANAFLLRNLPNMPAAFAEMARVVRHPEPAKGRPGGRLICLEITYPRFPPWRALFRLYFDRLVPLLGRWLTRAAPAYQYLPESLARFPAPEKVLKTMAANGWEKAVARSLFPGTTMLYTAVRQQDRG